jgi:hypothetical protein
MRGLIRTAKPERANWLGEVEGVKASHTAALTKLTQME